MQIEEVLANIDKKLKNSVYVGHDIEPQRQPTPSIGLNLALGGGFAYGRQALVWGSKASGKTSYCLQTIAKAQKEGKVCSFIDAEKAYSSNWAQQLDVDTEQIIYSKVNSIPKMADIACELMKAGTDIVVIDSINALLPGNQFDDDDLINMEDASKAIGRFSLELAQAIARMNAVNDNSLLILISQGRTQFVGTHAMQRPSGGNAVTYYSSQVIKLHSGIGQNSQVEGIIEYGDRLIKRQIGRKVAWTVENNKLGREGGSGKYDFLFDGDRIGVDNIGEVVDYAVEFDIIKKGGAWLSYAGEKWQGRDNAIKALAENKELYEKVAVELEQV